MASYTIIPEGSITSPQGFLAGAVYCGIKSYGADKLDLGVLAATRPCTVAGMFTSNRVAAAPILLCKERLQRAARAQAIIVNSGVANACTGEEGRAAAAEMAQATAEKLGIAPSLVLVASTGKIGIPIPLDRVRAGLAAMTLGPEHGHDLARAILTTDRGPKEIAVQSRDGYIVAGIAKGAGMIHPNLATMLAFITTDAAVPAVILRRVLTRAVQRSFNAITIDGDQSTNDTVLILASGAAMRRITAGAMERHFQEAVDIVCTHLAQAIVREGEGATKIMHITVQGAVSPADAQRAARAVASSNLVKCAIHGGDPNWGRIVCAVGYSGARVDQDRVDITIGEVPLMRRGQPVSYDATSARAALAGPEVFVTINLNLGRSSATAWGCDLSEEYVTFNSEYTT
jgi:glutamate N-acetyltransferase/amino-acid N-acetyltransferase